MIISRGHPLEWSLDPAASGRRWRCFIKDTPIEILVYETGPNAGIWSVYDNRNCAARASGRATSLADGQKRAAEAIEHVLSIMDIEHR